MVRSLAGRMTPRTRGRLVGPCQGWAGWGAVATGAGYGSFVRWRRMWYAGGYVTAAGRASRGAWEVARWWSGEASHCGAAMSYLAYATDGRKPRRWLLFVLLGAAVLVASVVVWLNRPQPRSSTPQDGCHYNVILIIRAIIAEVPEMVTSPTESVDADAVLAAVMQYCQMRGESFPVCLGDDTPNYYQLLLFDDGKWLITCPIAHSGWKRTGDYARTTSTTSHSWGDLSQRDLERLRATARVITIAPPADWPRDRQRGPSTQPATRPGP